jgi:hypothetical protein
MPRRKSARRRALTMAAACAVLLGRRMMFRRIITVGLVLTCLSFDLGAVSFAAQTDRVLSPTETLERAVAAIRDKDAAAYRKTLAEKSLALLEKQAKSMSLSVDELISAGFKDPSAFAPPDPLKTRDEKIDGDSAEVHFYDGRKWVRAHFVKEDKAWKIEGFSAPSESFKP